VFGLTLIHLRTREQPSNGTAHHHRRSNVVRPLFPMPRHDKTSHIDPSLWYYNTVFSNNPMDGTLMTPRLLSAEEWRFGPDWPGRRCGAKTRRGSPCQKPALRDNARCQIHGGRGGAPSGPANGNYKNGRYTKERIAAVREQSAQLREIIRLGKLCGFFG
jgi:hypothetical protein